MAVYHCGSDEGWSDTLTFTALNDSSRFSPRFALYGDLGNENPQSLARLQKETQLGMYDAILHIGAFCSYSYLTSQIGSKHNDGDSRQCLELTPPLVVGYNTGCTSPLVLSGPN